MRRSYTQTNTSQRDGGAKEIMASASLRYKNAQNTTKFAKKVKNKCKQICNTNSFFLFKIFRH